MAAIGLAAGIGGLAGTMLSKNKDKDDEDEDEDNEERKEPGYSTNQTNYFENKKISRENIFNNGQEKEDSSNTNNSNNSNNTNNINNTSNMIF